MLPPVSVKCSIADVGVMDACDKEADDKPSAIFTGANDVSSEFTCFLSPCMALTFI